MRENVWEGDGADSAQNYPLWNLVSKEKWKSGGQGKIGQQLKLNFNNKI